MARGVVVYKHRTRSGEVKETKCFEKCGTHGRDARTNYGMQETSATPQTAKDHFLNPRNIGEADEPRFVGRSAALNCGAVIQFSIQVDESHRILQAKFRAIGCDALVSAASMLTEEVTDITTAEAAIRSQRLDRLNEEFAVLSEDRSGCLSLASNALVLALQEYSNAARDEWSGDEALICTCFFVSERTIENEIKNKGLTTVRDVTRVCSAGGGCGSCHQLIQEIIDSTLAL